MPSLVLGTLIFENFRAGTTNLANIASALFSRIGAPTDCIAVAVPDKID